MAHREKPEDKEQPETVGQEEEAERIHADGYIESFAGLVEEGAGKLPLIVTVFTIGLLLWWLVYLVLEWSQAYISVRTLWR